MIKTINQSHLASRPPRFGWSRQNPPQNKGIVAADSTTDLQWAPFDEPQLPRNPYFNGNLFHLTQNQAQFYLPKGDIVFIEADALPTEPFIQRVGQQLIRKKEGIFQPQQAGFAYVVTPFENHETETANHVMARRFAVRTLLGVYEAFKQHFNPQNRDISVRSNLKNDGAGYGSTVKSPHFDGDAQDYLFTLTYGPACADAEKHIQPQISDPFNYLRDNGFGPKDHSYKMLLDEGEPDEKDLNPILENYTLSFTPQDNQGKIAFMMINNLRHRYGVLHGATTSPNLSLKTPRTLYRDIIEGSSYPPLRINYDDEKQAGFWAKLKAFLGI